MSAADRQPPETFRLPVEKIRSAYYSDSYFAHLETLYLGTLARRTLVMTNARRVVEVAAGKPILFFPAERVRAALDEAGHEGVRIVASGGFDSEKIERFERLGAPVDACGVGSALLRGSNDFTADVVELDGRPCAKAGRRARPNPRLEPVA